MDNKINHIKDEPFFKSRLSVINDKKSHITHHFLTKGNYKTIEFQPYHYKYKECFYLCQWIELPYGIKSKGLRITKLMHFLVFQLLISNKKIYKLFTLSQKCPSRFLTTTRYFSSNEERLMIWRWKEKRIFQCTNYTKWIQWVSNSQLVQWSNGSLLRHPFD